MSTTAIIGSTGFVGGNLMRQAPNAVGFSSRTVGEVDDQAYELVICAGARAEKWKINQDPETDQSNLDNLKGHLSKLSAKKFVLISTVDVYPSPIDVDEDAVIDESSLHPYGKHRLELERFCKERFDATIIRLPGLFGDGIKKNVIYDFLHNNNVDQVHADGVFQFYYLDHIWADIKTALEADLKLVNFATEPVSVAELAREAFGFEFTNRPEGKTAARYDFKTKHAAHFGGHNGYIRDKTQILADMKAFVERERSKQ